MTLGTITMPDGFTEAELTDAITRLPFAPTTLASKKLFTEQGIKTTKAVIDNVQGQIKLIPDTVRGAPGVPYQRAQRNLVTVNTSHFPTRARIYGDSWQDVRGIGTADLEDVRTVQNRFLSGMRLNLDASIEYQRWGALKGLITDATGAVTHDLFATFGMTQQVQSLALGVTTSQVANLVVNAKRKAQLALGYGIEPGGWLAFCASDFMDQLRAHSSLTPSFQGWSAAVALREDVRDDFQVGSVQFIEVLNPETGPAFIEAGTAYLVPTGVPNLLETYFSPSDHIDATNTIGQPYYVRAVLDQMGKYIDMEAQTNPISLCTRPRAIVKMTAA